MYTALAWVRRYNHYTGARIDHARWCAMLEEMGPIERAELEQILLGDVDAL